MSINSISCITFQATTISTDPDNGFTSDPTEVLTAEPISSSNISISIEQPPGADGNYPSGSAADIGVGNYTTQEVVSQGDLDPQTGVLYTDKDGNVLSKSAVELAKKPGIVVTVGANQAAQTAQQVVRTEEVQGSSSEDLLSSSLAQAQIDLDPFQFIDEGNLKAANSSENSVELPVDQSGGQSVSMGGVSASVGEVLTVSKSGEYDAFI